MSLERTQEGPRLPRVVLVPLAVGALVSVAFMLHAGEPERAAWWLGFAPFLVWALSPFVVAGVVASRHRRCRRAVRLLAATAVALAVSSLAVLHQGFVVQPDAQSGLRFVFLPLWQLVALLPVALVAGALARASAAAQGGPRPDVRGSW